MPLDLTLCFGDRADLFSWLAVRQCLVAESFVNILTSGKKQEKVAMHSLERSTGSGSGQV